LKKSWIGFAIAITCVGCSGGDTNTPTTETTGTTATTGASATTGSTGTTATTVSYNDIQEAFNKNCVGCHGENGKAGIDLRSYDSAMKGGKAGPIVKAGDPENSLLVHALRGSHGAKQMPMKAAALPEEVIGKVESWIKAGAKNE
jgi:mono/diheme cytochrome c family protein